MMDILKEEYGIEDIASVKERERIKNRCFEKIGFDADSVLTIQKLPRDYVIPVPREPRIPVSPYAKFDKYHHKKKKR